MKNLSIQREHEVNTIPNKPIWTFQQFDDGVVRLALLHGEDLVSLFGQTFKLFVKKPDDVVVEMSDPKNFVVNESNEIDIHLMTNMVDVPGMCTCELQVDDFIGEMTIAPFTYAVRPTFGEEASSVLAENYSDSLERLIIDVNDELSQFRDYAGEIEGYKEEIEGYKEELEGYKEELDNYVTDIEEKLAQLNENDIVDIVAQVDELQVLTENGNIDYLGVTHDTVKEAMDSNMEMTKDIIDEKLGWMTHEGQNISAAHTLEGKCKNATVSGKTLQNLVGEIGHIVGNYLISLAPEENKTVTETEVGASISIGEYLEDARYFTMLIGENRLAHMLEPATDYTISFTATSNKDITLHFLAFKDGDSYNEISSRTNAIIIKQGTSRYVFKIRTLDSFEGYEVGNQGVYLYFQRDKEVLSGLELGIKEGIVLKGDHSSGDVCYIEGIQSVGEAEVNEDGNYPIEVKSCGKNLFNQNVEYENMFYNSQGGKEPKQSWVSTVSPQTIPVGGNYIIREKSQNFIEYNLICYDEKGEFIENIAVRNTPVFTLPYNTRSFIFNYSIVVSGSNIKREDIQIEKIQEGQINPSPYEPYQESSQTIMSPMPLRKLPSGVCDEIDFEKGEIIQRIGKIVLNGTETGYDSVDSDNSIFAFTLYNSKLNNKKGDNNSINTLNDKLPDITQSSNIELEGISTRSSTIPVNGIYIRVLAKRLGGVNDVKEFKRWLSENPITVYYELAIPVIHKIDSSATLKSFNGTTHISATNYIKPVLTIDAPTNLQAVVSEQASTINTLSIENRQLKASNEQLQQETAMLNEMDNMTMLAIDEANTDLVGIDDMTMLAMDDLYLMIEELNKRIEVLEGGK